MRRRHSHETKKHTPLDCYNDKFRKLLVKFCGAVTNEERLAKF